MNDPIARGQHSPDAAREWLLGREDRGKLNVLQGCCLGVRMEVERWLE